MNSRVWDKQGVVGRILADIELPRMVHVRQNFDGRGLDQIAVKTRQEILKKECVNTIGVGMRIAVAVGSRGIANIAQITKQVIETLEELGAFPFIVPAMGSHGGATAQGQAEILESLGITELSMGVPIDSRMDVEKIDTLPDGRGVFISLAAAEADGIVIINRIKPHTAFRGPYESGLIKMMAIGLGKQSGAASCHAQGFKRMAENVPLFGLSILHHAPILFGVAILENSAHEVADVIGIPKESIEEVEPTLLDAARKNMARILLDEIDVLIIDEIGKNHSGDGMDPNVTGSYSTPYASGPPMVSRYVVLDASAETHGNALGVGRADFTTRRLFDKTDFDAMYPNSLTSKVPSVSKMPMVLNSDELAIKAAVMTCETDRYQDVRIVRIKSSSHVEDIQVSENLLEIIKDNPRMEIVGLPEKMRFDSEGNLF